MIAKRWVRGAVGVVAVSGVLVGVAGCETPPPPRAAPGPTGTPPRASAPSLRPAPPGPSRTGQPSPSSQPECPEGGVRLVEGDGDAAMGLRVAEVGLVNCGAQPYVLEGYPRLTLRDDRNDPVEVSVEHGAAGITTGVPNVDAPPEPVTLAPGQAASVAMVWRNLVTDFAVPAVSAPIVEIEPRAGAPRLSLRLRRPVDLGNTGKLGLGPWRAAAR
ncbi:DUF4232 domain-containing protein [Streptomyces sp. NPDC085524]|uniref:DUF4232 domain-containing protein n=1 Tax=unclassified Streptomyces TaxID=2593676 RepID=UPI0035DD6FD4